MPIVAIQPKPGEILNIVSPLTDCRFEWHPISQTVYIIRLGAVPVIADPIAFNIETHGAAWNAVLIFNRGYREAERANSIGATHG